MLKMENLCGWERCHCDRGSQAVIRSLPPSWVPDKSLEQERWRLDHVGVTVTLSSRASSFPADRKAKGEI